MEVWTKQVHVESSLPKKEGQYHLFIGRWQPLHEGHKQMFNQVLNNGGRVCIAIRDVEVNENNPFNTKEVFANLSKEYWYNENVQIIVIPDICSVDFGRGVGYDIVEHVPPTEVGEISATKIREQLKAEGKL
jgi:nicotinamide mononucleotide adenylyltransferase